MEQMNPSTKQKQTHKQIHKPLVLAKGEGRGNGISGEFGVSRSKLLHLKWISNEVLLYSTWSDTHISWDRT